MLQNLPEKEMAALTEALLEGKKIQAIGIYREATGQDLSESKKAVEEIEVMLHDKYPDRFPTNRNKKGCSISSGVGCIALAFVLFLLFRP